MKKNMLKVFIAIFVSLIFFTSCGAKKYSGFGVNKGIIEIPAENETILAMPLELYKGLESNISGFADKYNYFANVTVEEFELYKNLTMDIYSIEVSNVNENPEAVKESISKIVNNEKKTSAIMKTLSKMDGSSFEKIEGFAKELSDNFDVLIYIIGEVADFDIGAAPWYESRSVMFEEAANEDDVRASINFIEKYFPSVKFVLTYEETGAGKTGK